MRGFLDHDGKVLRGRAADIFLNTDRIDDVPVSIVEACAMGLPVIATDVGGISDLLSQRETGLLVGDDDDRAMADAVLELLRSPTLAAHLSRTGRNLAERLSWETTRQQWEDLFAEVMAAGEQRRPALRICLMCGICGIVTSDPRRPVDGRLLTQMRDSMTHRGPDDAGNYLAPGVGLGSRRLAILDLSALGHMPMSTPDGRFWIAYNGEIYNYADLRPPLQRKGWHFRSNTDTEVLLYLYATEGPSMLEKLNGMFAFAIWDSLERRLFIARDRLGVKPLFYARQGDELHFASEEKALFAAEVPAEFNHHVWPELLCFRYTAGEQTPFKNVKRLLPGHYLVWKDGQASTHRWWNLAERARTLRETPLKDPVGWYRETFDDAVRLRRISDVPVGVLLSGGLDSSTVAASLARQAPDRVASFTVGFAEAGYDETPLARKVADRFQLDSHVVQVAGDGVLAKLREACRYNDEPLAHSNDPHLLAISQHAKPRVTVLLSGEGADETLGGYVRYRPLRYPGILSALRPLARHFGRSGTTLSGRLAKLARFLELGSLRNFVLFNACDTLPGDLQQLGLMETSAFEYRDRVLAEAEELYPGDLVRQAMYSDQHTFLCSVLDRNDRMTMGASIECRVPFLDYRLVEQLAALPSNVLLRGSRNKPLLRRSLGSRLPEEILRHPKWGFGVPWRTYVREVPEVRRAVLGLAEDDLVRSAPFDLQRLRALLKSLADGDETDFALIQQLFMAAEAWKALRMQLPKPTPELAR